MYTASFFSHRSQCNWTPTISRTVTVFRNRFHTCRQPVFRDPFWVLHTTPFNIVYSLQYPYGWEVVLPDQFPDAVPVWIELVFSHNVVLCGGAPHCYSYTSSQSFCLFPVALLSQVHWGLCPVCPCSFSTPPVSTIRTVFQMRKQIRIKPVIWITFIPANMHNNKPAFKGKS